jgi:acyl-CoA reductase-like NAD-dependent aldehyde dehydrogenase
MFIDGKVVVKEKTISVTSPFNGEVVGKVACADAADVERVLDNARKAVGIMKNMPAGKRAEILELASQKVNGNEELARIISLEVGKTIREARGEVARAANTLKLSADACRNLCGETVRLDLDGPTHKTGFYQRVPIGIVLAITPFNYPLNLACHKIGPAVAAGNAVIHKPATATPLSAMLLAKILMEAGLPKEALSVITAPGAEIGDMLVRHTDIRKISFTGSPEIGERITQMAGLKKITMELGSNSALVVFQDAQLGKVVKKVRMGAYTAAGQVCISIQRVYVHESVFETFVEMLNEEVKTITTGDPLNEDTCMGPMINDKAAAKIKEWIDKAVQSGGRIVCGGGLNGAFLEPTILADVPENCTVVQEEVFAPLVVVNKFSTLDESIEKVNCSKYGLQAGIFTNNLQYAMKFADRIDSGGVMINEFPTYRVDQMPYGGVKTSGIGREGPKFAIEDMTEIKMVVLDYQDE